MASNPKIALAMIVKGSEKPEVLDRCLNSVAKWVDGIFITVTTEDEGVGKVGEKYGAVVDREPTKFWRTVDQESLSWLKDSFGYDPVLKMGDKLFQFDQARNHNFAQVGKEYDWILWMDTDDVLRAGKNLRDIIKEADSKKAEAVFLNYIYQAIIKDGKIEQILIQHLRERLVRNIGVYEWKAPIHETLIESRPTNKIESKLCEILHLTTDNKMRSAIGRNIKTLEYNIYENEARDPRTIYYLGKAYFDLKTNEYYRRALGLFKIYIFGSPEYEYNNKSGWGEERAQCWELAAEIYRALGENDNALTACYQSLMEDVKFPSAYLNLAITYLVKGNHHAALHWVKVATSVPPPPSTLVTNPRDLKARALEVTYGACIQLSMLDEAAAAAEELYAIHPDREELLNRVRLTRSMINEREVTKSVAFLANDLKTKGERERLKPLLAAVPSHASKNPFIEKLRREVFPPRTWEDNEVAIFCGPGFTAWSPKVLKGEAEGFVGGSEEAVMYLAMELRDLGWKVTVYAEPGSDEGDHDGVMYLPYFAYNPQDDFNIIVAWRNPAFVDGNPKAKKIYIWNHDIINPLQYTEERLEKIEKVIVLSPWHRTNIPDVPDEKVMVSKNGVTL